MDAKAALRALMVAIDDRRWADLSGYLHPDFRCRLVHTGEEFNRDGWIAFNAGYPGFDHLVIEELIGGGDAAACRSHVTGFSGAGLQHFGCASFAQMRDGLIHELTEVWTDIGQQAPAGTRQA